MKAVNCSKNIRRKKTRRNKLKIASKESLRGTAREGIKKKTEIRKVPLSFSRVLLLRLPLKNVKERVKPLLRTNTKLKRGLMKNNSLLLTYDSPTGSNGTCIPSGRNIETDVAATSCKRLFTCGINLNQVFLDSNKCIL